MDVIWWLVIIVAIIFLLLASQGNSSSDQNNVNPLDHIKRQYGPLKAEIKKFISNSRNTVVGIQTAIENAIEFATKIREQKYVEKMREKLGENKVKFEEMLKERNERLRQSYQDIKNKLVAKIEQIIDKYGETVEDLPSEGIDDIVDEIVNEVTKQECNIPPCSAFYNPSIVGQYEDCYNAYKIVQGSYSAVCDPDDISPSCGEKDSTKKFVLTNIVQGDVGPCYGISRETGEKVWCKPLPKCSSISNVHKDNISIKTDGITTLMLDDYTTVDCRDN